MGGGCISDDNDLGVGSGSVERTVVSGKVAGKSLRAARMDGFLVGWEAVALKVMLAFVALVQPHREL